MLDMVLCALSWERDRLSVKINLTPSQGANLLTPTAGQNQQSNNRAVIITRERIPNRDKFGVRQNSVAGLVLARLVGANDRVGRCLALANGPRIEGRQDASGTVGGYGATVL